VARRVHYWLAVFVALLLLAGCSFKTVYNRLDWVIASQVDDLITLNESQSAAFEQRVNHFLSWHRHTQLGPYAHSLQELSERIEDGLDPQDVHYAMTTAEGYWDALKAQAAPIIAESLISLTPSQREDLFSNLSRRNNDYKQEYVGLSEAERQQKIATDLGNMFERWVGELDDQQRAVFNYYAEQFRPVYRQRLAYRRQWQQHLRSLLDGDLPPDDKVAAIETLLREPGRDRSPEYARALAYNRAKSVEMILMLDRTLTKAQRAALLENIGHYRKMFTELADAGGS
jgi:hypothetical protein